MITLLTTLAISMAAPMNLPWNQALQDVPRVENYKYWYGDLAWGSATYLSTSDISGMESELTLEFAGKKIARATLILGPGGLNEHNCMIKYKGIVSALKGKYGDVIRITQVKDPSIDELLYDKECYALKVGLREISTDWDLNDFSISSTIYGEEEDNMILIEIQYTNKYLKRRLTDSERRKIIKRL